MSIFKRNKHKHEWTAWGAPEVLWNRLFQRRRCVLPKCKLEEMREVKGTR